MTFVYLYMFKLIRNSIDFFHPPFKRFIPKDTFRYAACGGGNLVLDILLYFLFYNFVFIKQNFDLGYIVISPHIAAFITVFPLTFMTGFLLQKYVTFSTSNLRGRIQLFRYVLTTGGAILINYVILKLLVESIGLYPTPSKMIATAITVVYSFFFQKYFTFKVKKEAIQ